MKKLLIVTAVVGLSIGTYAQTDADLKENTTLTEEQVTQENSAGQVIFDYEKFAERFLLVDEIPEDFPLRSEYTSQEEFKVAIEQWCEDNPTLVNQEAVAEREQRLQRQNQTTDK